MNTKKDHIIEGELEFSNSIACHYNVMGKQFDLNLKDIEGVIAFPRLPYAYKKNKNKNFLKAPIKASIHKNNTWGSIIQWPDGHSRVERALLFVSVDLENYQEIGDKAHNQLKVWKQKFENYLEIHTGQIIERKVVKTHSSRGDFNLSIFIDGVNKSGLSKPDPSEVRLRNVIAIDMQLVKQAIKFASSKEEVNLSYSLIMKARRELNDQEFRTAIIDAATSCEVTLNDILTKNLKKKVPKELFPELSKKKYKFLSQKIQLSRVMKFIPDLEYQIKLLDPRNEAAHKGYLSDHGEANEAIEIAEQVAKHFYKRIFD